MRWFYETRFLLFEWSTDAILPIDNLRDNIYNHHSNLDYNNIL